MVAFKKMDSDHFSHMLLIFLDFGFVDMYIHALLILDFNNACSHLLAKQAYPPVFVFPLNCTLLIPIPYRYSLPIYILLTFSSYMNMNCLLWLS